MTPDEMDSVRDTSNGLINRAPDSLPMDRYMAAPAVAPAEARAMPRMTNFNAAHADLDMTPEEQALYMRHLGNVAGPGGVDHPDGSRSTLFQMSTEIGNRVYNIPTVWDGKIVPPEQALKLAFMTGIDKFPSYATIDDAESRYMRMHEFMARDIADSRVASSDGPARLFGGDAFGASGRQSGANVQSGGNILDGAPTSDNVEVRRGAADVFKGRLKDQRPRDIPRPSEPLSGLDVPDKTEMEQILERQRAGSTKPNFDSALDDARYRRRVDEFDEELKRSDEKKRRARQ